MSYQSSDQNNGDLDINNDIDDDAPQEFLCPITYSIMKDPVLMPDGQTYEREAIQVALSLNPISPITREPMDINQARTNYALKNLIEKYVQNKEQRKEKKDSISLNETKTLQNKEKRRQNLKSQCEDDLLTDDYDSESQYDEDDLKYDQTNSYYHHFHSNEINYSDEPYYENENDMNYNYKHKNEMYFSDDHFNSNEMNYNDEPFYENEMNYGDDHFNSNEIDYNDEPFHENDMNYDDDHFNSNEMNYNDEPFNENEINCNEESYYEMNNIKHTYYTNGLNISDKAKSSYSKDKIYQKLLFNEIRKQHDDEMQHISRKKKKLVFPFIILLISIFIMLLLKI